MVAGGVSLFLLPSGVVAGRELVRYLRALAQPSEAMTDLTLDSPYVTRSGVCDRTPAKNDEAVLLPARIVYATLGVSLE